VGQVPAAPQSGEIFLLKLGITDDLLHVGVDLLDDVCRGARRGKQPERYARLVSRNVVAPVKGERAPLEALARMAA
jgi:hypothetical protein